MCGVNNSFFTHLKTVVPHLLVVKCVFNSLDKCAEYAYKTVLSHLDFILTETYNWFKWGGKRLAEYTDLYKSRHDGKAPAKLLSLSTSTTRWLIWLPCSALIADQSDDLRDYSVRAAQQPNPDYKVTQLASLFQDNANLLYLTFMRTALAEVHKVNLAFEHTNADVTKLYSDLRDLIFALSGRVLKERAMAHPAQPGVLSRDEVAKVKAAFADSNNPLPIDQVKFGERFAQLAAKVNLEEARMKVVRSNRANFLLTLRRQLIERLPPNLDVMKMLQYLSARKVLAKNGRPTLGQLPLDLASVVDIDKIESQPQALGVLPLHEICPHDEVNGDINAIDIENFWGCVLECENAVGEEPFKELDLFALSCLLAMQWWRGSSVS